jgi:hypothetical protein
MRTYYLFFLLFISCIFVAETTIERTRLNYAGRCTSPTLYQKTWAFTQNATGPEDNKYASISITKTAPELYCSNFVFSLPAAAANITRIDVLIRRYAHMEVNDAQATPISDAEIQIKSGDQTLLSLLPTSNWTDNNVTASYGGNSDTWSKEADWPNVPTVRCSFIYF